MIRSETRLVSTGPEADYNETIKVREPVKKKVWKIPHKGPAPPPYGLKCGKFSKKKSKKVENKHVFKMHFNAF